MENTIEEEWREIEGYDGLYLISDKGRVKSLPRTLQFGKNKRTTKEVFLSGSNNGNGYRYVTLCSDGIQTREYIHRLVAKAFLPNPEEKEEVNHKNGDKQDNELENLEWATRLENQRHAYDTGLAKGNIDELSLTAKRMIIDLAESRKYTNVELSEVFGISKSKINKIKHSDNQIKERYADLRRNKLSNGYKTVVFDKKTGKEHKFNSAKQAAEKLGYYSGYFSELITKYGGENEKFKVTYSN